MSFHSLNSKGSILDVKFEEDEQEEYYPPEYKLYFRMVIDTLLCVGLVLLVTCLVLVNNNTYKRCEPTTVVPLPPNLSKLKNVTSADFSAIVAFSGYLKFLRGDSSIRGVDEEMLKREPRPDDFLYLPLNLSQVSFGPSAAHGDDQATSHQSVLNLTTDCALLSLHLTTNEENSAVRVSSIDVAPSGLFAGYVEPCEVAPTAIWMGADESYVCPLKQEYPVHLLAPSGHKKRLVSIVFDLLCFEVHQRPGQAALKRGKFAKPAHYCFFSTLK